MTTTKQHNSAIARHQSATLMFAAALLFLASLMLLAIADAPGSPGRLMLTPEGCASLRLAGGQPESRDGICVASGRYVSRLSGWTRLSWAPGQSVSLSSRTVLLAIDDDSVRTAEDGARRHVIFTLFGICLVAAALCLGQAVRLGRRATRRHPPSGESGSPH